MQKNVKFFAINLARIGRSCPTEVMGARRIYRRAGPSQVSTRAGSRVSLATLSDL